MAEKRRLCVCVLNTVSVGPPLSPPNYSPNKKAGGPADKNNTNPLTITDWIFTSKNGEVARRKNPSDLDFTNPQPGPQTYDLANI